MKKSIIVNSKEYKIPEKTFSSMRDMEKFGVKFVALEDSPFDVCFQVFRFLSGLDEETALKEIDTHISNGGDFVEDIMQPITMFVADFFTKTKKSHQKQVAKK